MRYTLRHMDKVFIIHGYQGSPNGGWRPWLMGELEKMDVYACALAMPYPNDPVLDEWTKEIERHVAGSPKDRIYLVGHSLGVAAILRYLEKTQAKNVKGLVLVSGPLSMTSNKRVDSFLKQDFDGKTMALKTRSIVVIHGTDDPIVPASDAIGLAGTLNAKLVMVKNGRHLNGSAGWLKLPQCLTALKEMMA